MIKIFSKNRQEKVFFLGLVKISEYEYKMLFIRDFRLKNENYKGFYIDSKKIKNDFIFKNFKINDFNKWYRVEVDLFGDILYLHYKKWKIDL